MKFAWKAKVLFLSFVVLAADHTAGIAGCDKYKHYANTEIEQYFSILEDPKKSGIERSIAYDSIICSDDPVYRQHALKMGMQDTTDPVLRAKVLMDLMMKKDMLVIDLVGSPDLSKESRLYIDKNGAQVRFPVRYIDPMKGCISLYSKHKCISTRQTIVGGNYVEVIFNNFYGKFELTSNNDLEGYVIPSNRRKAEKIPARMNLF